MVVVMIIGILATFLAQQIPEMIDRANMTANEQNMSRIFSQMMAYRQDHNQAWPRDNGQKFFLRLWKDRYVDRTERNARMFFHPKAGPESYLLDGQTPEDYLDDWDGMGPGFTSYSGFDDFGDRLARKALRKDPGHTAILSDAELLHRNSIIYLTADGATHRLLLADLAEEQGLNLDDLLAEGIYPGPGCIAQELTTVSND